jgi:uncharacterized repeat protein (TIGR03803 family)
VKPRSTLTALGLAIACLLLQPALAASNYRVLHNFGASQDAYVPAGPLVLGGPGILYGAAGGPGFYGNGTVFQLSEKVDGTWEEAVLYSFKGSSDGAGPDGALIPDSTGDLYGTLSGNGILGTEGIFELTPDTDGWTNTVIYDYYSGPGLVSDQLGNLYGAIDSSNDNDIFGVIGELSPGSGGWTYTVLTDLSNSIGWKPPAPPVWGNKESLYGVTLYGGIGQPACWNSDGCGVAFEMTPNSDSAWDYHILHVFASSPTDGQSPSGGLVMGQNGDLYGVTVYGGVYKNGRVFRLSPAGGGENQWAETALYDFPYCAEGCLPGGTLALDQAGNLYGVASGGKVDCAGGTLTCGVVFKLSPQADGSWSYSVVHRFTGADGNFPIGVIVDDQGNLFGTTSNGGTYDAGVAFEITP